MQRRMVLGLLAYVLLLAGLALRNGHLVLLALPLWVTLGAALLRFPEFPIVTTTHAVDPPVVTEGASFSATLTVRNADWSAVTVLVDAPLPERLMMREGVQRCLARLAPQETLALERVFDARRGRFDFPDVRLLVADPSGLFERVLVVPLGSRLEVLPRVSLLRSINMRPRRTLGFAGPIPARSGGAGMAFHGVREYQPGDPLRRIAWRAMARYDDRAFTTEFEQERITDVGLILDVRRHTSLQAKGETLLEPMVRATAATAARLLRDGHRVGLLLYGEGNQAIFPGYGRVQQVRIMRALAAAEPAEGGFFDALNFLSTRMFPARSQLILVSPLAPGDEDVIFALRARGYSVLVVSPNAIAFEASGELPPSALALGFARAERALLLRRLRQGGVATIDWAVDGAIEERLVLPKGRNAPLLGVRPWHG